MNKIYQKSFSERITVVIPERYSRESLPCKTTKRLRLPTETLGNDGMSAKQPGFPNPAGRQTLGVDGEKIKKSGFTLIELLVVVLIIGILSAIALPQYEKAVEKSRAAEGVMMMNDFAKAFQLYYMETGNFFPPLESLSIQFPHSMYNSFWGDYFYCYVYSHDENYRQMMACYRRDVTPNPDPAIIWPTLGPSKYHIDYRISPSGEIEKTCSNSADKDFCSLVKPIFGIE